MKTVDESQHQLLCPPQLSSILQLLHTHYRSQVPQNHKVRPDYSSRLINVLKVGAAIPQIQEESPSSLQNAL